MKRSEMINDRLSQNDWLGEVVDITDPLEEGRVRVKVFGKFDKLEDTMIPWASPSGFMTSAGSATGGGSFSLPKIGSIVNVQFENDNLYTPVYTYIQHISDELKEEITGDNYETAQSLIFDTEIEGGLKIFYTEERGLMIKLGDTMLNFAKDKTITITNKSDDEYADGNGNSIVIEPDGNLNIDMDKDMTINIAGKSDINIEGNSTMKSPKIHLNSSKIELGEVAIEQVIKGNTFQALFNAHTHIGNMGAPTTPPMVPLSGAELSQVSKTQ
jgi:hypothetical protein